MSLDNIVKKIIDEAQKTVMAVSNGADKELDRFRAELSNEEKDLKGDANKKAKADVAEIIRRKKSSANLEGRKRILGQKEMILNEVFVEAKEKLLNLPVNEYLELLETLVVEYGATGDEIIMFSEDDASRLKSEMKAWTKELNEKLKKKGLKGETTVSNETREIEGGLILSKGRTEINLSFEVLLSELRLSLEGEIMNILFG
jgi:V/A-type H+/Na+-transporting ATPase subunit E